MPILYSNIANIMLFSVEAIQKTRPKTQRPYEVPQQSRKQSFRKPHSPSLSEYLGRTAAEGTFKAPSNFLPPASPAEGNSKKRY